MISLKDVACRFIAGDEFLHAEPYGEGHINDTYAAYFRRVDGSEYRVILQRINHAVFPDPEGLMNNIYGVTQFLKKKIAAAGGDELRETLTVIPTKDGRLFFKDAEGGFWRMYAFVEGTITYQSCRTPADFYQCGAAFGNFQRLLADYPTEKLVEPIADFHNTVKRFDALLDAIRQDKAGRVGEVQPEIDFAVKRRKDAAEIVELLTQEKMPCRVTHNDTKLNNILMDSKTGKGICVIDLDTVMPGAACYDFGDSIRFGASTAAEDETDLSIVSMSLDLFEEFAKGYLSVAREFLTPVELYSLSVGAKIMTFECGIRFLTDYLNGDVYFKVHREHHNLDRCRTQFRLVADMEQKMEKMQAIVQKYAK